MKLAVIICASVVSGCVRQGQGMQEAGEALGWEVTVYDGKGDPVAQNTAMSQAINSGANAVLLAATDPVPLSSSVELAKSKGIPVGTTGLGAEPGVGGAAFDVGPDYARWGTVLGSWIVADSKGTANFLPTIDEEFANSTSIAETMIETVKQCSGCTVNETQQFVVADIGNGLGQRIASELQRDPNINYVSGAYDSAAADMVTAIANAGIGDRISLVSCVGSPQNFQFVKDGNVQKVDMVQDDVYMGFAAVDQISRLLAGEQLWKTPGVTDPRAQYGEGSPDQLLTQSNIGDPSVDWVAPFDYQAKFKALWGVS
jgi:ABC-type sugar transport system substrate-binding protein